MASAKAAPGKSGDVQRVVLWQQKGTSNKVWVAQQRGATFTVQFGSREIAKRQEKVTKLASPAAAAQAMTKAVAAKKKESYLAAPAPAEVAQLLWERLGLAFDDSKGVLSITRLGPPASKAEVLGGRYQVGDFISAIISPKSSRTHWLKTVEELAIVIDGLKPKTQVYFSVSRKKGRITTTTGADFVVD